ncbi:MAG: ATP-binding cassette domain-containing protein [Alphaproteobacteria bacterium]|nr:ATP-binding cassette domain-containing protein [Alphaproteobacteria bacterium]
MTDDVIKTDNLCIGYETKILLENANFQVKKGDIFVIMGGSGCGKSTLLKVLTGLMLPLGGSFDVLGIDFGKASNEEKANLRKKTGILYQSGALFSSMTLAENVAMPLNQYGAYDNKTVDELVHLKLALVGLAGYEDYYPSEISGGMKKRAGLARALALDPEIVYFDEPSAGLDPVSSARLDDLMIEINQNLNTTLVVVTHELQSIFAIANNSVYLDAATKTITAFGNPHELLKNPPNERVKQFLTRGKDNEKRTK